MIGDDASGTPSVASGAPLVAFASRATNLAFDQTAGDDVFLQDLSTGSTIRVTANAFGLGGDGPSDHPTISADGSTVVFRSDASDLVSDDFNGVSDVFAYAPDPTDVASDLTGDGDFNDVVLERLDPTTGARTPICPSGTAAVAGGTAVFVRPEAAGDTRISLGAQPSGSGSTGCFSPPGEDPS